MSVMMDTAIQTTPTPAEQTCAIVPTSTPMWERVDLDMGRFKRRRLGAKNWVYYCKHGRVASRCKDCHGGSICEHNRQVWSDKNAFVAAVVNAYHLSAQCAAPEIPLQGM